MLPDLNHWQMRELETARLRLRPFQQTDLASVAHWEGTVHAGKFLEFCLHSYHEWGLGPWALVLKADGAIAGNCGFCRVSYDRAGAELDLCGEVNYYVAPQHRRQGFASEALAAVVKFGFGDLRLTRIQGRCALENVASERVLENAGMRFERMIASAPVAAAPVAAGPRERLYSITRERFQAALAD